MDGRWAWSHMGYAHLHLIFLCVILSASAAASPPAISKVVDVGRSIVFKHRVNVELGGTNVFSGASVVEATRYNPDTLLIFTAKDINDEAEPLVTGTGLGRAVVVKTRGGRVNSVLYHKEEDAVSLNYKRALASLLTPITPSSSLAYHVQHDVLGACEVQYRIEGSVTSTWRDLTRCSHFTSESVLGSHSLPLLHLGLDVLGSESQCEYRWRGPAGSVLDGTSCVDMLQVAPRFGDQSEVLNITVTSTLTHMARMAMNSQIDEYLQGATEVTDLTYHAVLQDDEDAASNASGLLKTMCSSGNDGRLTGNLLQKFEHFTRALGRSTSPDLPYLSAKCPVPIRRFVSLAAAIAGGPRALEFFVRQLAEFSRLPEGAFVYGEEFLFTLALRSIVNVHHPSVSHLPLDYFARRENQMVYEELIDYLLSQDPPAVAGVATLLEGLKEVAPQLFERLLEKSLTFLSPAEACEDGRHAEAVRVLRVTSGLTSRPFGYVASLRPCFATEDVGVAVAAMDSLMSVDCDIQGVTELQKLGLASPSDPEIRIAAYRGLVHCLPEQPGLLQIVIDALNPAHDVFSSQVGSYVWSHVQSVLSSDDPSQFALKELLISSKELADARDPVWYDPRQHSRHLAQTVDVDARTTFTFSVDLIWGRYSPAPRAVYLRVALHHDGETHDLAQVMLRVTGLERMILNLPGIKSFVDSATSLVRDLWTNFAKGLLRMKREITHVQIAEFIDQVMSRIPAEYRSGASSIEISASVLGIHAVHLRLSDLQNKSISGSLGMKLLEPMQATLLGLMPLLDNTFSMVTISGVPINLGISAVGGIHSSLAHEVGDDDGEMNVLVSGGLAMKTQVSVGRARVESIDTSLGQELPEGRSTALSSSHLWSIDLPFSAHYEMEGEETIITIQAAEGWDGEIWQHRIEATVAGEEAQMRLLQDCVGEGEPLSLCLDTSVLEDPGGGGGGGGGGMQTGWITPNSRILYLKTDHLGEPWTLTLSTPLLSGSWMKQAVLKVGEESYVSNLVLQTNPTASFALTVNSPQHVFLLKGFGGSRESITKMAGVEFGIDHRIYGMRAQLSTPTLENQRVWSPSIFIITPEEGEEEVFRSFLSVKKNREAYTTQLNFQTIGPLVEYLKFEIAVDSSWSTNRSDGSLREVEFKKFHLIYPGGIKIKTDGKLNLRHDADGQISLVVDFDEAEEGVLELSFSVNPVVKFQGSSPALGGGGGSVYDIGLKLKHNRIPEDVVAHFKLLLDRGRVDTSLNFHLSETGGFNVSHIMNDLWDFKTTASIQYSPLNITWGGELEFTMRDDEFRHFLKTSWSQHPQDYASTLIHYTNHNMLSLDRSFKFVLMYPGQVLELEDSILESRGGSIKNIFEFRMDPGQTVSMETVIIYRQDITMFSYGISNSFKMGSWISPLNIVGTANCIGSGSKCSVAVSATQAGDQLADLEIEHTAAAGVSRSDAKITVTDILEGAMSADAVTGLGYYDVKWEFAVWYWMTFVAGHAEADLTSVDLASAEMTLHELLEDEVGKVTCAFNATVSFNPEIKALFSRQEVRLVDQGKDLLWVGVVQGRLGEDWINSRHFGKVTLVTPNEMYYALSGDLSSEVSVPESVKASVSFSADTGPQQSYLLSWNLNFQQPNSTSVSSMLDIDTLEEDEEGAMVEDEAMERSDERDEVYDILDLGHLNEDPLVMPDANGRTAVFLQTLLRGNSPLTGEIKLKVKASRTDFFSNEQTPDGGGREGDSRHGAKGSEKYFTDIRLIRENDPELGRIHGSLTRSPGIYSLNGRMWSSSKSFGVVSYAMARNDSLKSSHSATIVDPTTSWRRIEVVANSDHLGSFPYNFQTSGDCKVSLGFEEAGAVRALVQYTPFDSALNVGFHTFFEEIPGGTFYYKLSPESLQGALSWREMKAVTLLQWVEGGRAFQFAINYDNPGASFNDLDAVVQFALGQGPYIPFSLVMTGRVSVNSLYHSMVNIDCQSQKEEYLVTGALVRPGGSSSLRLQFKRAGEVFGALGALVIDSFSAQIGGSLKFLNPGEELQLNLHSSLLEEQKGYSLKVYRKFIRQNDVDVVMTLSQAGDQKDWIYAYKLFFEMERDFKGKIRRLRMEDQLTYEEYEEMLHDYNFLIVVVSNKYDEMEVEIEFPDIWSEIKVTGTVVKGKDTQFDLVLATSSIKHLLEGRLIFGSDSWWSSHSGSFSYAQQGKKGRGQPFKLEVEGFKWNSNKQKYKLTMQKMVDEFSMAAYKNEANAYSRNDAGTRFVNFDAALDFSRGPGSREFKMTWETDETENSATVVFEEDQSGGKALLKYSRDIKGRPKAEVAYEVKANYRRFDTEVTLSATLDHTHIGRPRAISFLHSDAEGYTELVLDLFRDEGDQVILVVTYLPESFRVRVGQFGNTFLQVGYQMITDVEDDIHRIQLESSGRSVEVWVATSSDGSRTCREGGFTLQTPTLAPTYNVLSYCPSPSPELTLQILGVEEHEGPYLHLGQISGPGGVGVQLGSGRLRPLDTPPALTLTADVEEQILEMLLDWQSPSIAQLKEEVNSRGTSFLTAVEGLGDVEVNVEGSMELLEKLLEDTEGLLEEAEELLASALDHITSKFLDESSEIKLGHLVTISGPRILEYLKARLEYPLHLADELLEEVTSTTDHYLEVVEEFTDEIVEELSYAIEDVMETVAEGINDINDVLNEKVRPPLLRIHATFMAISYNDDQSLYDLVSRMMGHMRSTSGRQVGLTGFIYSNTLTRVERVLVKMARWDQLRQKGRLVLDFLSQVSTFDAVMPHGTALKLRIATPPKLAQDLKKSGEAFREERLPQLIQESELWFRNQWSRLRYLLTWHVHGESVVFGWDQAITWDGRQVAPMLTASCHHMLALLINARTPTAVTIHLKDLETRPRKVFTFFSGTDRVTIDSNLKMTYNNQHVRRPLLKVRDLTLSRSPGTASVKSYSGLSLECEDKFDTCRLEVSYENFAATAGLLGVFDFDNNTDFMTSGWEIPATEEEWAQSWRVASMEECSSDLPDTDIFQHSEEECSMTFKEPESVFSSCFTSRPPSPYYEACRSGWACGAESAYTHVCQGHYHELQPNLTVCKTCHLKGLEEEGTDGLNTEIVLITDFTCLEDMQDLVTALTKGQSKYKLIIRYIGRGAPPYSFEGVTETVVDSDTSPLESLSNAVKLDFSERAFKSVILFDCDDPMCTITMSSSLIGLRDTLLQQGIQLHVITKDSLQITDRSQLSNKVRQQLFGIDVRTTYTLSIARKRHVRGKRRFRKYVTTPLGNTCADIAVQTDGSVFSLAHLKIERKYHKKIYQQLVALRVRAGQEADYLHCRRCECDLPCTLCSPPQPFTYTSHGRDLDDEDDEDEDYDDEEDVIRVKKKKKKKSHRPKFY